MVLSALPRLSGWLAGKHVVFGKVKEGMNTVEAMQCFGSRDGKTSKKMTISDGGQTIPSVAQESAPHTICSGDPVISALIEVLWAPYFPHSPPGLVGLQS